MSLSFCSLKNNSRLKARSSPRMEAVLLTAEISAKGSATSELRVLNNRTGGLASGAGPFHLHAPFSILAPHFSLNFIPSSRCPLANYLPTGTPAWPAGRKHTLIHITIQG